MRGCGAWIDAPALRTDPVPTCRPGLTAAGGFYARCGAWIDAPALRTDAVPDLPPRPDRRVRFLCVLRGAGGFCARCMVRAVFLRGCGAWIDAPTLRADAVPDLPPRPDRRGRFFVHGQRGAGGRADGAQAVFMRAAGCGRFLCALHGACGFYARLRGADGRAGVARAVLCAAAWRGRTAPASSGEPVPALPPRPDRRGRFLCAAAGRRRLPPPKKFIEK